MNISINVRYYMAEFFGTFLIFFIGIGAFYLTNNAFVGALSFGGSYLMAAMTLQHISKAHFNPVITFAAWLDQRITIKELWIYVFGQITGALFGVLSLLVFENPFDAIIQYDLFSLSTYTLEMFFAFIIVYVYLAVSEQPERRPFLGLAVGMSYTLVFLLSLGMNQGGIIHPLRFIETGILNASVNVIHLLVLWFSLEVGGLLAALFYRFLKYKNVPDRS